MKIVPWLMMMVVSFPMYAGDDLCEIVGLGKTNKIINNGTDYQCAQSGALVGNNYMNDMLVARLLMEQRVLIAEIRGLREEMKSYSAGLASARANFNSSISQVAGAQEAWRAKALSDTLDAVAKMPAELAKDEGLRTSLTEKLKVELVKDDKFIGMLRESVQ